MDNASIPRPACAGWLRAARATVVLTLALLAASILPHGLGPLPNVAGAILGGFGVAAAQVAIGRGAGGAGYRAYAAGVFAVIGHLFLLALA